MILSVLYLAKTFAVETPYNCNFVLIFILLRDMLEITADTFTHV